LFSLPASVVALLSTVGNVMLENNVKSICWAGLNLSGRSLATPVLQYAYHSLLREMFPHINHKKMIVFLQ